MTEEHLKKYLILKSRIEEIEDYLEGRSSTITSQLKKDKVAQNEIRKPVENEVIGKISKEQELEKTKKEKKELEKEIIAFLRTIKNPLHRNIIMLKYLVGYNTIEIAGTLKVSKKTIINNLSIIRKTYLKK